MYEGAWQVAKAAMSAASKLLATQGGGKFAANSRPGTTIIKPKSKKKLDGKSKKPMPEEIKKCSRKTCRKIALFNSE